MRDIIRGFPVGAAVLLALLFSIPSMLDAASEEDIEVLQATIESLQDEQARIRISGTERARIMNIQSDSDTTTGPYGEILRKGASIRYRLGLKIEATVSPSITAGGWLRLSNEGHEILTQGPDYLSLDYGSAFVRYHGEQFRMTLGYYPIRLTPLTLMRWDLEDNPQGGGSMACAVCGTAAGLLSAESQEELGPALIYEGARAGMSFGDVCDVIAFYANPNRTADSLFHRDLWGLRSVVHAFGPGASAGALGVTFIRADDDENSLPGGAAAQPAIETELIGLDGEIQVFEPLSINGEWVRTRALKSTGRRHGEAYMAGTRLLLHRSVAASIHYIHIDPWFRSPYSALSYLSDRQGIRLSGGWRSSGERATIGVFYKKLEEVEGELGSGQTRTFTTWGFSGALRPRPSLSLEGNLIFDLERRDVPANPWFSVEVDKETGVLDVVYHFDSRNEVRVRYQVTDVQDRISPEADFTTHLTSVLWTVGF